MADDDLRLRIHRNGYLRHLLAEQSENAVRRQKNDRSLISPKYCFRGPDPSNDGWGLFTFKNYQFYSKHWLFSGQFTTFLALTKGQNLNMKTSSPVRIPRTDKGETKKP